MVLEKAYEVEKVTEVEVLDEALALGRAYMWMDEGDESQTCLERAKAVFVRLLGEKSCQER